MSTARACAWATCDKTIKLKEASQGLKFRYHFHA
jgi:hypothetical protein